MHIKDSHERNTGVLQTQAARAAWVGIEKKGFSRAVHAVVCVALTPAWMLLACADTKASLPGASLPEASLPEEERLVHSASI